MTPGPGSPAESYLAGLARRPIPASAKGFVRCGPTTALELAGSGRTPSQAGLTLPLAVLRVQALDHNVALMQGWARQHGAELAPHVKTTMAPWIMARQLAAGAWALTVANCTQASVCTELGAPAVLIANQVVDPADIEWIAAQLRDPGGTRLLCYADSVDGVRLLADGLARHGVLRPLELLVEVGAAGGRAGCRSLAAAVAVAAEAARSALLVVRGVAGFEGVLAQGREAADLGRIDQFSDRMHAAAVALAGQGLVGGAGEPVILSAAGSVYFDRVAARLGRPLADGAAPLVVLRSGGYVSHDHGHLDHLSPLADARESFAPALEVWARILSVPEPDLAIAAAGKRDVGTDLGLPAILGCAGPDGRPGEIADLCLADVNDQHAYVRRRGGGPLGGALRVGDAVPGAHRGRRPYLLLTEIGNL